MIGPQDIWVALALGTFFFGAKKLPELSSSVGQARIVIPIVFRNEYLTGLRNLSREGRCDLYVRTLSELERREGTN